jgi:hypothetical protein
MTTTAGFGRSTRNRDRQRRRALLAFANAHRRRYQHRTKVLLAARLAQDTDVEGVGRAPGAGLVGDGQGVGGVPHDRMAAA